MFFSFFPLTAGDAKGSSFEVDCVYLGELSKLLLAWLGSAKRALATVALGSFVALVLWRYPPFAAAIKDPLLRWPLGALVFSLCGLTTYLIEYAAKAAWKTYKIPRRLRDLTPHEETVLKRYLEEQTTVLTWGRIGEAAEVLRRDGVLHLLASDVGPDTRLMPMDAFSIDPIAWRHLHMNPELVGLERNPSWARFPWQEDSKKTRGKDK
jgi:hypothetical protein